MSRLAFQTQLASIMEVLANAAVAEICKLVDDDYAVVTLQMSQVQKENKALKRKLHLLELKMARGTAERRLRESQGRGGGLRVTVSGGERLRELSPSEDGPFSQSSLWPLRSIASGITEEPPQSKSPDVQFVEPEPLIVKEETEVETKEEEVHLIEDNVVMETPALVPDRPQRGLELLPQPCAKPPPPPGSRRAHGAPNRRVEEEDSNVVLVKVEEPEEPKPKSRKSPALSIQEGLVESSTDDFKSALPFAKASQIPTNQLEESSRGLSEVSFGWNNVAHFPPHQDPSLPGPSSAYTDPFSDLQISNVLSGSLPPEFLTVLSSSSAGSGGGGGAKKKRAKTVRKKNCACDFCDKRFSSPANLESHLRTHTGEKPFACNVCGKLFSQFWNMKIHKNIHTGERPYQCSVCNEKFSDPSNLKKHEKRHLAQNNNPNNLNNT